MEKKIKHWKNPIQIVAVSNWLAECAKRSEIMKDWPITTIPNCLNTDIWKPVDKVFARKLLGLPIDAPMLLLEHMELTLHTTKALICF